ncbi:MAG: hypothetical protein JXQ96_01860 [Cyclobacteriaceae bacterium]
MQNIKVIASVHNEIGPCNPDSLYNILMSIRPEVIFEEQTDDEYYRKLYQPDNNSSIIEIKAIKKYKENFDVVCVPVDLEPELYLTMQKKDYYHDYFKKYDIIRKVNAEIHENIKKEGFNFLNSDKLLKLDLELKKRQDELVQFGSPFSLNPMKDLHESFLKENEERESAMIENIYSFSKTSSYEKAVFIPGFSHLEPLIKKIMSYETEDDFKINWSFYGDSIHIKNNKD